MAKVLPSNFTSFLLKIKFKQEVSEIKKNLQPCIYFRVNINLDKSQLPLLRNYFIADNQEITINVRVTCNGNLSST